MTKKAAAASAKRRIRHAEYGLGTIVDVNERYTTIDFDEAGTKKFITDMVRFTPSDAPPPSSESRAKKLRRIKRAPKK